jgi:hypothetical protein
METAAFNLERIEIEDAYFPDEIKEASFFLKNYIWQSTFNFKITEIKDDKVRLNIVVSYRLQYISNQEYDDTPYLKTRSYFKITGRISAEPKLRLLYQLMAIAMSHCQGVFAAKTEGTVFEGLVFSMADYKTYEDSYKTRIANEWRT